MLSPDDPRREEEAGGAEPERSLALKLFHLQILYELGQELAKAEEPAELLDIFLPIAMGSLGVTSAYVALCGVGQTDCQVAERGLGQGAAASLAEHAGELVAKFFPEADAALADPAKPGVLAGKHLERDPLLPSGTRAIVTLPGRDGLAGFLGLGAKLSGEPFLPAEIELLQGLARSLGLALARASAARTILRLNDSLTAQNRRLERTLEKMERAREELNLRAFQLKTLYDASSELAGVLDSDTLLETFLLMILGAFSVGGGYVILLDDARSAPQIALRHAGDEADCFDRLLAPEVRQQLLKLFVAQKDRLPQTMESLLLTDEAGLTDLPLPTSAAVIFALDESTRGIVGLFDRLAGGPYTKDEQRLMTSLMANFLVCLDNARRFETIAGLNADLNRRNVELKRTLDELTSAKVEIGRLKVARERILAAVRGGFARLERVSPLEIAAIVLVAAMLGLLFNLTNPAGIELVPQVLFSPPPPAVSIAEAERAVAGGAAVIVDARPTEFYRQEHIAGAESLPLPLFDFVYAMKLATLPAGTRFIVYGRTFSRHWDREVAARLAQMGVSEISVLEGGLADWKARGLATAEGG